MPQRRADLKIATLSGDGSAPLARTRAEMSAFPDDVAEPTRALMAGIVDL
jgi:hypothetical protein